jgi:molecular chaperone HscB
MPVESGKNYFELFDLPVTFDIDTDDLSVRYRELQRRVHPDKFASGSDQERRVSMQMTTLVNEAFQTLRDSVKRARYLLGLKGIDVDAETDTAMDPVFLTEQIELRESLEEVKRTTNPHKPLAELANQIDRRMETTVGQFRQHLSEGGGEGTRKARAAVREMQFLDKLREEIDNLEEELI